MNTLSFSGLFTRLRHRLLFHARLLNIRTKSTSFTTYQATNSIQRIYVINLDRKLGRWYHMSRELKRIRSCSGEPLFSITRRFSAIDARYLDDEVENSLLKTEYSLADQLLVDPSPRVSIDEKSRAHRIKMTPQETAIALSHIEIWKIIASSDISYTLVLEDDVFFRSGFSQNIDKLWRSAMGRYPGGTAFDLFYLSFKEVGIHPPTKRQSNKSVRKPDRGIWQASGYVLSQSGARKLVELLPAYGPIDLWLNLQFGKLDVLIAQQPIIDQRVDMPSTNSYSIMPVLSQIGVHTHEKPLIAQSKNLGGPIFAYGEHDTGLTALAKALSMLGYTCCSDLVKLPISEQETLLIPRRVPIFNAHVNIGTFDNKFLFEMAKIYPKARFIFTTRQNPHLLSVIGNRALHLPYEHHDKWAILSEFLGCEYPTFSYPLLDEIGQRDVIISDNPINNTLSFRHLKFDVSPWIVASKNWPGISIYEIENPNDFKPQLVSAWNGESGINHKDWKLRDDTFPSNLALFTPDNANIDDSGIMALRLVKHNTPVRAFASSAIATRQKYLYGRFSAEIRPPKVGGLVTGIFLHRNSPYQEIDIEFLGKDTTKMLINVFYNPGIEGTKLEYGYRGTPTLIELGFDAAKDFHEYEIEWQASSICWRIDGQSVHKRLLWNPTPIPDLPMEFNINLWHSRSRELAGSLDISQIPAKAEIKTVRIMQKERMRGL